MPEHFSYFKRIEPGEGLVEFAEKLIGHGLLYRKKRRQNGALVVDDHLAPVREKLSGIIIHPDFREIASAFGLLHDVVEDFPSLVKCQDPFRYSRRDLEGNSEYGLSLNYLLEPAGEAGRQLVYCIDKPTKRYVEKGRKYSEHIFRLNRKDPRILVLDLIVVNMKNCDIGSNTNPDESVRGDSLKFRTKKVRNALRYLYYDLPRIGDILDGYKDFRCEGRLLYDYGEAKRVLEENYSNIFLFLKRNPIYAVMKENADAGQKPLGWPSLKDLKFYKDALNYLLESGFRDRFPDLDKTLELLDGSGR